VHCLKSQFLEIRTLGPPIKKPRVGEHEFPAVQSQPVAFWLRSIWFTWFHMVPRSPRSPSIQQISTRSETWLRMAEICWELLRYLTFQDFPSAPPLAQDLPTKAQLGIHSVDTWERKWPSCSSLSKRRKNHTLIQTY
jgi:hypothetical protein